MTVKDQGKVLAHIQSIVLKKDREVDKNFEKAKSVTEHQELVK